MKDDFLNSMLEKDAILFVVLMILIFAGNYGGDKRKKKDKK